MANTEKIVLNITDAPTWTKFLPLIGIAAGIGLAIYQKKDCIGCFLGYGLSGALIGAMPLYHQSRKAASPQVLEDCGCSGSSEKSK